jgi:hypothetical protein
VAVRCRSGSVDLRVRLDRYSSDSIWRLRDSSPAHASAARDYEVTAIVIGVDGERPATARQHVTWSRVRSFKIIARCKVDAFKSYPPVEGGGILVSAACDAEVPTRSSRRALGTTVDERSLP